MEKGERRRRGEDRFSSGFDRHKQLFGTSDEVGQDTDCIELSAEERSKSGTEIQSGGEDRKSKNRQVHGHQDRPKDEISGIPRTSW